MKLDCGRAVPTPPARAEIATGDLPVAAQPAVFAPIVGAVARGIIFNDFDIAGQTRAGVSALD